jgi:secretion/DNA translocation related TadE-like protein
VTVLVTVTVGVLVWSGALVARQRAQSAADLAALAAARHAGRGGDACAAAARVVRASGANLIGCAAGSAADVLVEVEVEMPAASGLGVPPARARARAGPSG